MPRVSTHVLKKKGYIELLDRLEYHIDQDLATDIILKSLPESYNHFLMIYYMNNMQKSISFTELHSKLLKRLFDL